MKWRIRVFNRAIRSLEGLSRCGDAGYRPLLPAFAGGRPCYFGGHSLQFPRRGFVIREQEMQDQQQEVPAASAHPELHAPSLDVDGLRTYEIVEMLIRRPTGGSACDDSRPMVVEHMDADGLGEYVRIPEQLSLEEAVPVALLSALEAHRLPYAAYRCRWIEEWRIVLFAPPRGAWNGSAAEPMVIELTLHRVSERELSDDESAPDDRHQFLWSVSSAASLSGCVPAP